MSSHDKTGSKQSPPDGLTDLLVINQVVGPLAREMMEDFGRQGIRCKVLTGWVDNPPGEELTFEVIPAVALVKWPTWKRFITWGLFTLQAMWCLIRHRKTPVLVATNPPWVMLVLPWLNRLLGLRYVLLIYDLYPDVLERMGKIRKGGFVSRRWRAMSRKAMLRAAGVITLGDHIADTLRGHLREGEEAAIEVIPSWADTDFIKPVAKADNPFAREHGLTDKFVVLYSGSFGATHDIGSIIEAARKVEDLKDVQFVLIGGGTRQREVTQLVAQNALPNLTLLRLQPLSMLPYTFGAADCAIACLDEGYEGISMPSKTYYVLAAGAALLAVSQGGTELADLVRDCQCGKWVGPRDAQAMADAVRALHDDRALLERCRKAAREAAVGQFSRRLITGRYVEYLRAKLNRE